MNKREKLIELMNKNSLDGLIFAQSANFQYLLGTKDLYWQRVCMNNIGGSYSAINYPSHLLYIDKDGEFHIITPPKDAKYFAKHENVSIIFMEEIQDELEKMITSPRIGVGFDCFE
ncbi:MAG: aminopeptidase P family N-terminal domain-containing protein, partial [Erysipelotrichaceae bacterium]